MRVIAPHDGILVFPMNWRGEVLNIGDTAWPGQTVAEIPISRNSRRGCSFWRAMLLASLRGIARASRSTASPVSLTKRRSSASIPLAKPRERGSPVKYFETWLDLPPEAFKNVKPGQRVRATILLAELAEQHCGCRAAACTRRKAGGTC